MWERMSDEQLVASSDLIVIGEWLGQSQVVVEVGRSAQGLGVVAVSEVLKGSLEAGFALVQRPGSGAVRSSSDLNFERGQTGLWLLRAKSSGTQAIYLTDHPQRFVSASADPARIASLRRLIGQK